MTLRTRVKICGITDIEDALAAVEHGADAIGLVFYPSSPRHISIKQAKSIVAALPPFVSIVALFVDATAETIHQVLQQVHIDCLQFHGDEAEAFCQQFNRPYYKAVRVKEDTNLVQYVQDYQSAQALLLDAYSEKAVGGTGQTFNWQLIPDKLSKPIVLAGGLNADNVQQAITQVKPYAVDVSGGVEKSKGVKDIQKIAAFIDAVHSV